MIEILNKPEDAGKEPAQAQQERWLNNSELALRLWQERVKPEQVASGLGCWNGYSEHSCQTVACFGGWLATWPEFHNLGVFVDQNGAPGLRVLSGRFAGSVSYSLFGSYTLFKVRGICPYDDSCPRDIQGYVTDHALVVHRLNRVIAVHKALLP